MIKKNRDNANCTYLKSGSRSKECGQAKIRNFDVNRLDRSHQDILDGDGSRQKGCRGGEMYFRFYIAMNDIVLVKVDQGLIDLNGHGLGVEFICGNRRYVIVTSYDTI